MPRNALATIVFSLACFSAVAQISPPEHESNYAHVRHSRAENYSQRFEAVKCAIVQVFRGVPANGTPFGTGFYINPDGGIVTASHVVGDRAWSRKPEGVTVDLTNSPDTFTAVSNSGEMFTFPKSAIDEDREAWGADIAYIATGHKTKCWLTIGNDAEVKPGDRVITMGFPGLAFGSLSLYEGIVSATRVKNNIPMGIITGTNELVTPENEFIRVQMPISGGLSGAPVLDDQNRAVSVVTLAGVWSPDLDFLIQLADTGQLGPVHPAPSMVNLAPLVGALAKSFHQYSSPGYGDSVPLRYLKKKTVKSVPTSSRSAH